MRGAGLVLDLLILTNLALLAAPRIALKIRLIAIQGLLLGTLPVLLHGESLSARLAMVAIVSAALKGGVFPWWLSRTWKQVHIKAEVAPVVGHSLSVGAGVLALIASLWLGHRLPLPPGIEAPPLAASVSLVTIFTGFFLIVARRKALTQVIGYLVLENGVYLFGTSFAGDGPMWVELGVLLDLVVAVLVMGIAVNRIDQTFDSIDSFELRRLHD